MASRIVHVTAHYPPFLGGLEKVVQALVAYRSARGLEVSVLTAGDRPRMTDRVGRATLGEANQVRHLRSWEVAHTAIIPGLPLELLTMPRSATVHLHVSQAFVPEAVYVAHLLRGLPYVAHLHIDVGPSGRAGVLLRAYKPLVLRPILRSAARVVVFTRAQRSAVAAKYGIAAARIAVIPNGVEETFLYSGRRLVGAKPRLLFVGRLSPQKNLPLLLHALAGVSEHFETTLVGDGELEGKLRNVAASLGLQNIRFHGRADGDELRDLYRSADVFVLPSEREGMPLVLLEAMAMGLPVVATDIPGIRDVIAHGTNGILVPPNDVSALRMALKSITADLGRYQLMCTESSRIASRFSWAEIGAHFERLYAEVGNG